MYARILQGTLQGFMKWPILFIPSLMTLLAVLAITLLFDGLWTRLADSGPEMALLPVTALALVQQAVTLTVTVAGTVIPTRMVLARLRGEALSLAEAARVGPYMRQIATYAAVYTLISTALAMLYLFLLFGPRGITYLPYAVTGLTGLTMLSTDTVGATACLVLLVFVPAAFVWSLANILAAQVITAEQIGGMAVIRRGWRLVRRTLVVFFWLFLTVMLAMTVLLLVSAYVTPDAGLMTSPPAALTASPQLLVFNIILNTLVFMASVIFSTLWYGEAVTALEEDALGI